MDKELHRVDKVEWQKEFNVNVIEIDKLHYELFCMFGDLSRDVKRSASADDLLRSVTALLSHAGASFETESIYFDKFGYTDDGSHSREHERILNLLTEFQDECETGRPLANLGALVAIGRKVITHVATRDREFADYMKKNCRSKFLRALG